MFFMDELCREACTFLSATTLRLDGAPAYFTTFRSALRRDGTPVQSGDTTSIGVAQAPGNRAIVKATLTLGAQDTLTLSTNAADLYKSTAGAGLPAFSPAGAAGDVYCSAPVDFFQTFDDAGNLLRPELFRNNAFPEKVVLDFLSELGTLHREAVFAQGVAAAEDGLAGLFAMDTLSSSAEDGEDVFENDHTTTGRVKRLSTKPWPTKRGDNIGSGNALDLFSAAAAGRRWLAAAWDATGAHSAIAFVLGHATDPYVDVIREDGAIAFELSGTTIRIRNNTGGAATISHIKPIIG